jgi:mannan endo-1,6-alpha-mannosidase
MSEISCEVGQTCNYDQPSFKAYLSRWLAVTTQLAPDFAPQIWKKLSASAQGAAKQCSGGTDGVTCGERWYQDKWDGKYGIGEQMSALAVIGANIMQKQSVPVPVTGTTGGTSKGDPNAGMHSDTKTDDIVKPVTGGDKAGAAILTAVVLSLVGGLGWWLLIE